MRVDFLLKVPYVGSYPVSARGSEANTERLAVQVVSFPICSWFLRKDIFNIDIIKSRGLGAFSLMAQDSGGAGGGRGRAEFGGRGRRGCAGVFGLINELEIKRQGQYQSQQNRMADIECVFESVSGRGSLYISNLSAAQNPQLLHNLGIRAVLSVARSGLVSLPREQVPFYLYIPAQDREDYQIRRHFEQTFEFIEQARKETNVLVHCMVGVSRSVTIVIAYLLKKYRYSLGQVVNMLQRRRHKINPNTGFLEQLRNYAEQLGLKNDFKQIHLTPRKEHSLAKQKRLLSAPKDKNTPKLIEQPSVPDSLREKLAEMSHKPEIVPILYQKSQELRRGKSEIVLNQEEPMTQSDELPTELSEQLMKSQSTQCREGRTVKRLSIQEKIGRVREKILRKEFDSRLRLSQSKENNNRVNRSPFRNDLTTPEKNFKAKIEEHFPANSKEYLAPLGRTGLEEANRLRMASHHMRYTPPFHIFREEPPERDIFNAQIRIQPTTLYTPPRLQPRSKPNN